MSPRFSKPKAQLTTIAATLTYIVGGTALVFESEYRPEYDRMPRTQREIITYAMEGNEAAQLIVVMSATAILVAGITYWYLRP